MTKYITFGKGAIPGSDPNKSTTIIIQEATPRNSSNRLVKCKNKACGELVPDEAYCIECGQPLK